MGPIPPQNSHWRVKLPLGTHQSMQGDAVCSPVNGTQQPFPEDHTSYKLSHEIAGKHSYNSTL